jgi:hypothetical protein
MSNAVDRRDSMINPLRALPPFLHFVLASGAFDGKNPGLPAATSPPEVRLGASRASIAAELPLSALRTVEPELRWLVVGEERLPALLIGRQPARSKEKARKRAFSSRSARSG